MAHFPRWSIFLLGLSLGLMISLFLNQSCNRPKNYPSKRNGRVFLQGDNELQTLNSISNQRILCVVMTHDSKHRTRATAVRDTWGRHCNILLFMSNILDPSIPTIDTGIRSASAYKGAWPMTVFALKYIQQHFADTFDWIYKCDDDTYAIIENMAKFLSNYSSSQTSYFGFHIKHPSHYMSGGAGYVLSKETFRIFLEHELDGTIKECSGKRFEPEDVVMGDCMRALGVKFEDSRDAWGRQRFFTESVESHTFPRDEFVLEPFRWYRYASFYPTTFGLNCCAVDPISFHHVTPQQMYALEYLTYLAERPKLTILQPEWKKPRQPREGKLNKRYDVKNPP